MLLARISPATGMVYSAQKVIARVIDALASYLGHNLHPTEEITKEAMGRSGNVRVSFRLRPMDPAESTEERYGCIHASNERGRIAVRNDGSTTHFNFDRVFDDKTTQATVYKEAVEALLRDFLSGRNCSVICYGELGSGKTYSLFGSQRLDGEFDGEGDEMSSLGSAGVSRHPNMLKNADGAGKNDFDTAPPHQVIAKRPTRAAFGAGNYLSKKGPKVKGVSGKVAANQNESIGIASRMARDIFKGIRRRSKRTGDDPALRCSIIEIYNEKIIDLLDDEPSGADDEDCDQSLSVISDADHGVIIENAFEELCTREDDLCGAIEDGLRNQAERAETLGIDPSRAHLLVILKLERYSKSRGKRVTSNMFLVDLANSALIRKPTVAATELTVREARCVKRSLGALRKCLRSLALNERGPTPPFGDSLLTKILHNSLVRGAGVSMVVTANPSNSNLAESMSGIRYGIYVSGQREGGSSGHSQSDRSRRLGLTPTRQPRDNSLETSGRTPVISNALAPLPSLAEPHSPDRPSKRTISLSDHLADTHTDEDIEGNESVPTISNKLPKGYEELEIAGQLLKHIPDDLEETNVDDGGGITKENLVHVSTLLEHASKRMEKDLDVARKELKASGFQESLTAEEMEKRLEEVTKEIENMKYGGHLSVQIQKDILKAKEELRVLSAKVKEKSIHEEDRSGTSSAVESSSAPISRQLQSAGSDEVEAENLRSEMKQLRDEMASMRRDNMRLTIEKAELNEELQLVRKKTQNLEAKLKRNRSSATSDLTDDDGDPPPNVDHTDRDEIVDDEPGVWEDDQIVVGPSPIKVCLRLRPMTRMERNRRSRNCFDVHDDFRKVTVDSPIGGEYDFCFDNVFDVEASQEEVFDTVGRSVVDDLIGGVNCAVMAYGLTGSGKSHTLIGKLAELHAHDDRSEEYSTDEDSGSVSTRGTITAEDAGFFPRVMRELFRRMKEAPTTVEFLITCSYVAIFLEKMFDLLDPKFEKSLLVKDGDYGVEIEGATEAYCFNENDLHRLGRRGAACRKLIGSKLKIESCRSHAILMLRIEQRHIPTGCTKISFFQLAELAGFGVSSKAKGQSVHETMTHKSFSALGNVIKSLTEGNVNPPYREAKLTTVLKEALGGNSKSILFITASPSSCKICETINSIRLGQRVRRVTNRPRVNRDVSIRSYRKWLMETESRLGELSTLVKSFAKDVVESARRDCCVSEGFSVEAWRALQAIAEEEESLHNPCRSALILQNREDLKKLQKWRWLSAELIKMLPSDELLAAIRARDKAEGLLSDIQSEFVVLRRQNDLLVQQNRKNSDEVGEAQLENRQLTMKNSELEYKLTLAENRARDAIFFVRFMRSLCWRLRKDVERDRPLDIAEITQSLAGAPDLSGLVDLDSLMLEAGIIDGGEVDIDKAEDDFNDYLESVGLVISQDEIDENHHDIDELADLDDLHTEHDGRWAKRTTRNQKLYMCAENSLESRPFLSVAEAKQREQDLFGPKLPRTKESESPYAETMPPFVHGRNSRKERELQRDLQIMANKCVELQVQLNEKTQHIESLCNRAGNIDKRKLAKEASNFAKERDRMIHKAKASTWKLQELHVTNKLLQKQSAETKHQVTFLKGEFQRLQESFRQAVQDDLNTDAELRERVTSLQAIVDSLTGHVGISPDEEFELSSRMNVPIRGRRKARATATSEMEENWRGDKSGRRRCLVIAHHGKRIKKRPVAIVQHKAKWSRKSRKTGTSLIGAHRDLLMRAAEIGKFLYLPSWEEDDDDVSYASEELSYTSDDLELNE